jgi:hypothetical protein
VERDASSDLVILRANPLDDIANTRAIAGVVAAWAWLRSQAEIEALRKQLRARAGGAMSAHLREVRHPRASEPRSLAVDVG